MSFRGVMRTLLERLTEQVAKGDRPPDRAPIPPAIPPAKPDPESLAKTVNALKTAVDQFTGATGSLMDKPVSLRDLVECGVMQVAIGDEVYAPPPSTGAANDGFTPGSVTVIGADPDPRPFLSTPPTPENLTASDAVETIILTWDLLEYRNHSYVEVFRHTANNLSLAVKIGTSTSNIYVDADVVPEQTYYYWVRAVGFGSDGSPIIGAFNATAGVSASATKVDPDPRPFLTTPPTPTNLTASDAVQTILLTWDLTPYRNHLYVEVFRHTANDRSSATKIGTSVGSMYVDAAIVPEQTYYYWVRAVGFNKADNSTIIGAFNATAGVAASATKADPDPRSFLTTPPTPTNLTASDAVQTILLTWDLTPYRNHLYVEVFRNTTNNQASATKIGTSVGSMYVDAAIVPGQTYYYWVRAVGFNKADNSTIVGAFNAAAGVAGSATKADPDPRPFLTTPPAPTGLAVSGAIKNIILTWDLTPYRNHLYVEVFRNTTNNQASATKIGTSESNIYVDATAAIGQTYYYWVRAVGFNEADNSTIIGAFNSSAGTAGGRAQVAGVDMASAIIDASKLLNPQNGFYLNDDPFTRDPSAWAWPNGNPGSIIADPTQPFGGSAIAGPLNIASSWVYSSRLIPIDVTRVYSLKMYVAKSADSDFKVYLLAAFYDASGAVISGSSAPSGWPSVGMYHYFGLINQVPPSTSYTEYAIMFGQGQAAGIPADARYVRVGALLHWTGTTGRNYLGGVRLTEVVQADLIAAGAVTAAKLSNPQHGFYLNDDPFTRDSSAWTWFNGPTGSIITDTTQPFGGSAIAGPLNTAYCYVYSSRLIPIDVTRVYRLKMYAAKSSDSDFTMYLLAAFYDASGAVISGSSAPSGWPSVGMYHYFGLMGQVPPSTSYTEYAIMFGQGQAAGIPADARYVRVGALLHYTGTTGRNYLGGVRLTEIIQADLIAAGAVTAGKIAAGALVAGDGVMGNLYVDTAKIADLAVAEGKIANLAVTTGKIADAAITNVKIADAAINTAKIADAAITNAKIANLAVSTAKIDDLAVTTGKIADAAISTAKIADAAINTAKIADAAITNAKIANLAVSTAKIDDLAVTTLKVADLAISTAKIADLAVNDAKIANLAVTTGKIADLAVAESKIADAAITNAKIANAAVTNAKIADASISTAKIADAAVTNAKIANLAVKLANIDTATITNLSALSANLGAVTAGTFSVQHDGNPANYGYARSHGKWWNDGTTGWVFARDGNANSFAEIRAGTRRFWMSSWGDCGINWGNFSVNANGDVSVTNAYVRGDVQATSLDASTANIVDTIHLNNNAVTIPEGFSLASPYNPPGSGYWGETTVLTGSITVPANAVGQKLLVNIYAKANLRNYTGSSNISTTMTIRIYRNGVLQQESKTIDFSATTGESGGGEWGNKEGFTVFFDVLSNIQQQTYTYTITAESTGSYYVQMSKAAIQLFVAKR